MRKEAFKTVVVLAMTAAFLLVTALAFGAEAAKKQYVVIKDKKGVCKVVEVKKGKTPATIAGPFPTRDEAMKEKEKLCPKPAKKEAPKKQAPAKEGNKKPATP